MKSSWRFKGYMLLALSALLLVALGCSIGGRLPQSTGLYILLEPDAGIKQMVPAISMVCSSYDVTATGPTPFSLTMTGNQLVEDILPGSYHLEVVGKNLDGTAIGAGALDVDVIVGLTTEANVIVSEYDGVGSFSLGLQWEPSIISAEGISFDGVLKDAAGVETPMVFTGVDPVAAVASSLTENLARGWFSNIVKIYDAGVLSCGFADVVRIVAGQTTEADIFLHAVEGHATLDVRFTMDFYDPLHLVGSPAEGSLDIYPGAPMMFSVSEADSIAFDAVWYLNGEVLGTGPTAAVDGDDLLDGESFRLDCLAFSTDGKHADHSMWTLSKVDMPAEAFLAGFTVRIGGADAGTYILKSYDESGAVVQSKALLLETPYEDLLVFTDALPPGSYRFSFSHTAEVFYGGADLATAAVVVIPQWPAFVMTGSMWVN